MLVGFSLFNIEKSSCKMGFFFWWPECRTPLQTASEASCFENGASLSAVMSPRWPAGPICPWPKFSNWSRVGHRCFTRRHQGNRSPQGGPLARGGSRLGDSLHGRYAWGWRSFGGGRAGRVVATKSPSRASPIGFGSPTPLAAGLLVDRGFVGGRRGLVPAAWLGRPRLATVACIDFPWGPARPARDCADSCRFALANNCSGRCTSIRTRTRIPSG